MSQATGFDCRRYLTFSSNVTKSPPLVANCLTLSVYLIISLAWLENLSKYIAMKILNAWFHVSIVWILLRFLGTRLKLGLPVIGLDKDRSNLSASSGFISRARSMYWFSHIFCFILRGTLASNGKGAEMGRSRASALTSRFKPDMHWLVLASDAWSGRWWTARGGNPRDSGAVVSLNGRAPGGIVGEDCASACAATGAGIPAVSVEWLFKASATASFTEAFMNEASDDGRSSSATLGFSWPRGLPLDFLLGTRRLALVPVGGWALRFGILWKQKKESRIWSDKYRANAPWISLIPRSGHLFESDKRSVFLEPI